MRAWSWNPRTHLAAAIGWAVFFIITLFALIGADRAAEEVREQSRHDTERLLTQFAIQIQHSFDMSLDTRRFIVEATAAQIVGLQDLHPNALVQHFRALQTHFPEFKWLGVADDRGEVVATSDASHHGESVVNERWFAEGQRASYVGQLEIMPWLRRIGNRPDGDVEESHDAVIEQDERPVPTPALRQGPQHQGKDSADPPTRFIDIAVPLVSATGQHIGVLSALLSWRWVEHLHARFVADLATPGQLDMILAANDGTIMIGPDILLHSKLAEVRDFTESGRYVVGRQDARDHVAGAQRWTVIVRQPAADAFGPAETAWASVFLTVTLAGLLASAAAAYAAHALTRRLARLDANAEAVLQGALTTLGVPPGKDEISRIGATLAALVSHLQKDKASLQSMNEELDARVAERTAQIAKLAEESKHAAVTRERLRLARDLHDTLAHSLMALLTQIRMVRMVRETLQSCELDAELLRAEEVATSGLTAARGAIAQMRNFNVHDTGLGGALRDLVNQFSRRSGIPVNIETDLSASQLADDRAEVAFRIAQEALRNVEQHAHAGEVRLNLRWLDQTQGHARVRLEIIDDGQGFDTSASRAGHYGLRGMEEQAALIGAQLELESQHGRGTRIALLFTVA